MGISYTSVIGYVCLCLTVARVFEGNLEYHIAGIFKVRA